MQAACQRGSDQRQHLVPRVRPSRRAAEVKVMVDELPQAQVPGEGGRQEQAGIGHQAMVVKEDADTVGIVLWQHLLGAPCFRAGFCSKTIIPDSEEHPLASSRAVPKAVLRWIRAKAYVAADGRLASRRQLALEKKLLALCHPFSNDQAAPQAKLCRRIERFIKELFVFVSHPDVPSENNAAERSLRHLVISRKISGGTRSEQAPTAE